jgi:uncharacterized membrane protein (UPF0127 family)
VLPSLLAAVLMAAGLIAGCAPEPEPEPARVAVTLGGVQVSVEIADDDAERGLGLQDHEPLAPGEGMLFVFDVAAPRTFAMKDVDFPIDIVFIAEDLTVSAIEPLSPGEERLVNSPGQSRYVIELPQGWAAGQGVGVGSAFVPPE